MASNPKITEIPIHSQSDALKQTLRGIEAYALSRKISRGPSPQLTKARDTVYSAFQSKVLAGSDAVKSAMDEIRAYRMVSPAKSLNPNEPVKLVARPQPVLDNTNPNFPTPETRFAPYDDEWVWGNQSRHEKNKMAGTAGIFGACGGVESGPDAPTKDDNHLEGAAGVTASITSDRAAIVTVVATIRNNWSYGVQAHGGFSSASSKGGIDMAAFRDGQPIDGPRRLELFSDYANDFNQVEHTGGGTANVTVSFRIEPGQWVGVPFGAWLVCDHSSGVGTAGASGFVRIAVDHLTIIKQFV
jgi:hypothetical protein